MYKPKFNNEEEEQRFWEAVNAYLKGEGGINKLAGKYKIGNKLRYYLSKNQLTKPKSRQDINHKYFKYINTEDKAYWLGFIYADGNVSDYTNPKSHKYCLEITLKGSDRGHLEKFKKSIGYSGDIRMRKINGYSSCRLSFSSKELIMDLVGHGCTPRKSLNLEFPTSVPDHLIRHFIRGYFDGDGSVNSYSVKGCKRPKINLSIIGTYNFLDKLQEVINSQLGLDKSQLYSKNDTNPYEYKRAWNITLKILHYLYNDSSIYLDRKYNFFKDYCRAWGM